MVRLRRPEFTLTGYPFDSANHEEEVVWGGRPCTRPVPLAGLLGGRTRASAAVQGDRPTRFASNLVINGGRQSWRPHLAPGPSRLVHCKSSGAFKIWELFNVSRGISS